MSFQSGQVKQVIRTYAVEIQTSDKRELDADAVTMKLRKAMGANCEMSIFDMWEAADIRQMTDRALATELSFGHNVFPKTYVLLDNKPMPNRGFARQIFDCLPAAQRSSVMLKHRTMA